MSAPAHRGDILVVDDTPENIAVLSAVLKQRGHRVRAVTSGALALRAIESEAPDLVILDVCMPQMDGYEVCRRLKAREDLRGIPVLFASALSDTLDKVKAFSAGAVDYVTKPYRTEEISARVETHLALRHLQVELERRHAQLAEGHARLQELEAVRQTLVKMIIHDLKSPLAAVRSSARFLRKDAALEGECAEAVEDIEAAGELMSRMVMDVLDVASSTEGALRPRWAALDVGALLAEVAAEARARARERRARISVGVAPGLGAVSGDRELLRRILANLADNSLKYAPAGTEVRLSAAPAGEGAYALRVEDEGPGIPPEHREAIFEPYRRLARDDGRHARTSRGLGLAFCRMAAEAHGGSIRVEDALPCGSAFVVVLPLRPAGQGAEA